MRFASNGMDFQQQPQMLPAPKKSVWLWLVLGAVCVIVLLFSVYYYYADFSPLYKDFIGGAPTEEEELSGIESALQAEPLDDLTSELDDIGRELAQ